MSVTPHARLRFLERAIGLDVAGDAAAAGLTIGRDPDSKLWAWACRAYGVSSEAIDAQIMTPVVRLALTLKARRVPITLGLDAVIRDGAVVTLLYGTSNQQAGWKRTNGARRAHKAQRRVR